MSDVIAHLLTLVERVTTALMPSELHEVVCFLRGDDDIVAAAASSSMTSSSAAHAQTHHGHGAASATVQSTDIAAIAATAAAVPAPLLCAPHGLLQWHGVLPLAIVAGGSLSLLHMGGGHGTLRRYFADHGFARVLVTRLTRDGNDVYSGSSGSGSTVGTKAARGVAAAAAAGSRPRRTHTTRTAATTRRGDGDKDSEDDDNDNDDDDDDDAVMHMTLSPLACLCAMRQWCERVVRVAHVEAAADAAVTHNTAAVAVDDNNSNSNSNSSSRSRRHHAAPAPPQRTVRVHRLLVLVHCHANNRAGVSMSTAARRRHGSSGGDVDVCSSSHRRGGGALFAGVRRHRYGADVLHALLHRLAAVARSCVARLRHTTHRLRVAVLLLPEDYVYGAVLLARQLSQTMGDVYRVRVFAQQQQQQQQEQQQQQQPLQCGGGGSARMCVRRVLHLWAPHLLLDTAQHPQQQQQHPQQHSQQQQQQLLSSSSLYFFLRTCNVPLCCYLRDVLRCYPHIVPVSVLRAWQRVWAVRRSLQDVAVAVHTALMPFVYSRTADGVCGRRRDERHEHTATTATAAADNNNKDDKDRCTRRVRNDASSVYADATLLIDALLCATDVLQCAHSSSNDDDTTTTATTLSQQPQSHSSDGVDGDDADEAVLFMLLYDELVRRCGTHVLHTPALVDALATLARREALARRACTRDNGDDDSSSSSNNDGDAYEDAAHAASVALRCLLPYSCTSSISSNNNNSALDKTNTCDNDNSDEDEEVEAMCAALLPSLPHTTVTAQLQQTALMCVLPPAASLWQLRDALAMAAARTHSVMHSNSSSSSSSHSTAGALCDTTAAALTSTLSARNFYSDAVPDAVRVLHVLTAHAATSSVTTSAGAVVMNSRRHTAHTHRRTVTTAAAAAARRTTAMPLSLLRDVCALSDEQLLRVLAELHAIDYVAVDLHEQTARSLLHAV